MGTTHHINRSEWDEAYMNVRVTPADARLAVVVVALFALVALLS